MGACFRMGGLFGWLLVLSLLASATSARACSPKLEAADVQLTITVQKPSGEPVRGVPVSFRTFVAVGARVTDASGLAAFTCQTGVDDSELFVCISGGPPTSGDAESWRSWSKSVEHSRQVISDYAFERFYIVPLVPEQTKYALTISARPAIRVSGVVADEQGGHPTGFVTHGGAASPARTGLDGTFTLGGVAKDTASECFVCFNDGRVFPVAIPASAKDVELGSITIPARTSSQGALRLCLTNLMPDEIRRQALNGGVTLISENGSRVFTFLTNRAGEIRKQQGSDELPQVPPGTYYVAPGLFSPNGFQLKLLHALRRQTDLAGVEVPKLVVTAGQEAVASIDVIRTRDALAGLPDS